MKVLYSSNVYSGFSFAVSYAPNTSNNGLASTRNGQQVTGTAAGATWASYNDLISAFGKYAMEIYEYIIIYLFKYFEATIREKYF